MRSRSIFSTLIGWICFILQIMIYKKSLTVWQGQSTWLVFLRNHFVCSLVPIIYMLSSNYSSLISLHLWSVPCNSSQVLKSSCLFIEFYQRIPKSLVHERYKLVSSSDTFNELMTLCMLFNWFRLFLVMNTRINIDRSYKK